MPSFFPKTARLCQSQDFRIVRKEGKQTAGRYLLVTQRFPSNAVHVRLGITASKRFGKAHVRNRFKRLVREAFRLSMDQLPKGLEVEVIPKKSAVHASLQEIQQELLQLVLP